MKKKQNLKNQKYGEIFKSAKDKYFASNMSITEVYNYLKEEFDMPEELSLYDIFDSIIDEARACTTFENYNTIIVYERQMRDEAVKIEALSQMIENAQNSNTITPQRRKEIIEAYNNEIQKSRNIISSKKREVMKKKNTVYEKRSIKSKTELEGQITQQNSRETMIETRDTDGVASCDTTHIKEPKKKKGLFSFIKSAASKLGITPKDVNEEVSELADLQKHELQEARVQPKAIKDTKTSPLETATINVGSEEPVIEAENSDVGQDER